MQYYLVKMHMKSFRTIMAKEKSSQYTQPRFTKIFLRRMKSQRKQYWEGEIFHMQNGEDENIVFDIIRDLS